MRVLFIESDDRFIFGLPLGFRDAGHKIVVTGSINTEKLKKIVSVFKPELVVVLGWSSMHTAENIDIIYNCIRKQNIKLIYWATEDPTFLHNFSLPLVKKILPNYIFTVSKKSINSYTALGFRAAYLPFGYQPSLITPLSNYKPLYKISLVANAYPNVLNFYKNHYRKESMLYLLKPLLEKNIHVDIWGKYWDKMQPFLGKEIPDNWLHGSVHYLKANAIYQRSDIILCLQNYNQDVIAMRTFEILGASGFFITSSHEELRNLFSPDKDFIMVASMEEMMEKYSYYVKKEERRNKIKQNTKKAAEPHTYKKRAEEILLTLKNESIF